MMITCTISTSYDLRLLHPQVAEVEELPAMIDALKIRFEKTESDYKAMKEFLREIRAEKKTKKKKRTR